MTDNLEPDTLLYEAPGGLIGQQPIKQYGALCIRRTETNAVEVLLITTRETKRWCVPKGWPIDGLSPFQVAEREAWEEAGVLGHARRRPIGSYAYEKKLSDGELRSAIVDLHVLLVYRCKKRFPERRERQLAWLLPDEAARRVGEPELQRILRRLCRN